MERESLKNRADQKNQNALCIFQKNTEYPYWIFGAFVFVFVIPFRR